MRGASVHAVTLCALFFTTRARADGPCVVRLDDATAPRPWRTAVDAVARGIGDIDTGDCAEIRVTPETAGAMVTFTTRDGRIAQRHIRRPNELRPLVDALTVSLAPTEPAPAPAPELLGITESTADATVPADEPTFFPGSPTADRGPSPSPRRTELLLLAGGGARTDGHADGVVPQGQLGLGIARGKWELDLVGRLEAEHDLETTARHSEASSMGIGMRAARREKIGPILLVTGVALSAQYASVEAHPARDKRLEVDFLEPRAGAFIGVVGPRIGRFRLRGELLGELALSQRSGTAELPATSGWGMGCMFGLETSLLP